MFAPLRAVTNLLVPPYCPLCGERTDDSRSMSPRLCRDCAIDWSPERDEWCHRCGAPVPLTGVDADGCVHCRGDRFAFAGVRSLGEYDGRLRTACRMGKEKRGAAVPAALADVLADVHAAWFESLDVELVVPVPRHWTSRWWSEHDAAQVLAMALAGRLGVPLVERGLVKVRRTPRQSRLSSTERRKNLRDAFAVLDPRSFVDRRVLLVDDVLTTGTTADRCSRELVAAGAASVHVAVLARGIGA